MDRRRAWTLGILLLLGAAARVDAPHASRGEARTEPGYAEPALRAEPQPRHPGEQDAPIRVVLGQGSPDREGPVVVLEADDRGSPGLGAVRVLATRPLQPGLAYPAGPVALSAPPPSTAGLTTAAALAFLALRRRT